MQIIVTVMIIILQVYVNAVNVFLIFLSDLQTYITYIYHLFRFLICLQFFFLRFLYFKNVLFHHYIL